MLDTLEVLYRDYYPVLASYLFFIGLCFGSFFNVVIYRLPVMMDRALRQEAWEVLAELGEIEQDAIPRKQYPRFNLAWPASTCPHCGTAIRFWQNIPVLSYLLLRGKCHACHASISPRYPMVELLTGLLTLLLFHFYGLSAQFLLLLVLVYGLVISAFIDIDHLLLPDSITLPLLWLGLVANISGTFVPLTDALYGAVFGYGSLWLVANGFQLFTGKEGMGYGDLKLMAVFGAWFGWQVLPNIIFMSALVGAALGIGLIVFAGHERHKPLPYGPFIIVAGLLTILFPAQFMLLSYLL